MLAIVPAAGAARRMGAPKLLLPFAGTTILGATVAALRSAGVTRVMVVTAPENEALRSWATAYGLDVAVNPEPERGMLSSIWAGIQALEGAAPLDQQSRAILVTPGDLPLLRAATVQAVDRALAGGNLLAQPRYRGRNGHPLAIATELVDEILSLDPAVGLRQLRERHAARLAVLDVDDPGCVEDVDTPEDYAALRLPAADQ